MVESCGVREWHAPAAPMRDYHVTAAQMALAILLLE